MTVAIRFYNGFLTLNEPISNLFITSNHKATKKQRLYRSTRDPAALLRKRDVNFDGVNLRQWRGYPSSRKNTSLFPHRRHYYQRGLYYSGKSTDSDKSGPLCPTLPYHNQISKTIFKIYQDL